MRKTVRSSAVLLSLALVSAFTFTLALAGAAIIYAQEPQGPPPGQGQAQGQGHPFHHHGPNAEFETKMLTKRLGLSADQAARVEHILASQDEQLKAMRPAEGTQPDFKAMHDQRKSIMDQTKLQLDAIFTPDQQAEFARMHGHRGPGGPHGNWQGKPGSGSGE